jgi:hypothetical protein
MVMVVTMATMTVSVVIVFFLATSVARMVSSSSSLFIFEP